MKAWSIALRNLLRNRRRSLATLLALAVGALALLLFGGYITNIRYSMQTAYIRTGGHLQVQHRDYFFYGSGDPTAYGITDYEQLLTAIREDKILKGMITVASPTLQFLGVAGNFEAGVSRTIAGVGVVASEVGRMRQWNDFGLKLGSPHFLLDGSDADAALIGKGVARVLLLCEPLGVDNCQRPPTDVAPKGIALPDDIVALADAASEGSNLEKNRSSARLELLASHGRGSPNVASVAVLAAEAQGFKEVDDVLVVLHLSQAQKLVYGKSAPRVTSIMIQLAHTDKMAVAAARLATILADKAPHQKLVVLDFEKLNPFYVQSIQLFDTLFAFIFALIGCIVLFTVSNTITASVVERTMEIGTLRAIGMRRRGIRSLFLKEGFLMGCVGTVTGTVSALLVAFVVNQAELTWLPPGTSEPLPLSIRVWGEADIIFGTVVSLVAIATASAWLPAYRAAKLQIVEALRHA